MKIILSLLTVCALAQTTLARDIWTIGGSGATLVSSCVSTRWEADARLYNVSNADAAFQIVHVSNGGPSNLSGSLPAGASERASFFGAVGNEPLWAVHFDVPDSIVLEDRLELFRQDRCNVGPPSSSPIGKISIPIFDHLAPADTEVRHLGADLGGQHVRLNVAIYNAATTPANATITLNRPFCTDDAIVRVVTLPPDTLQQIPIASTDCSHGAWWPASVSVTVDRPSLSFVSTLANDAAPATTASVTANEGH